MHSFSLCNSNVCVYVCACVCVCMCMCECECVSNKMIVLGQFVRHAVGMDDRIHFICIILSQTDALINYVIGRNVCMYVSKKAFN